MDLHDTIDDEKYDNFNELLDRTDDSAIQDNVNNVSVDVTRIGGIKPTIQSSLYGNEPQLTEGQALLNKSELDARVTTLQGQKQRRTRSSRKETPK